jgi:ligand-binding sensor domain-containing protein
MVRNIKKGRNGTILIASFGGVFRYDGKSFTNITSKISSPSFWDVLEDRKGNLWLATRDSGVYYYNGKSFQHFTTREGLANNFVCDIYEDKAGIIWFGTGGGVSRYDGKSFRNFTTKEGLFINDINTIMEDKTGKLWFGTGGGAGFHDAKTFKGKPFRDARTIIEDKKGNIWLGGSDGLWRYNGSTFTNVTQKFVGYVYEDSKGNIWTTGEVKPNGYWALFRYDQKSLYNKKPTVTEITSKYEEDNKNCLFGILEANDGSIWVGGLDGVYRYDGNTFKNLKRKEGHK